MTRDRTPELERIEELLIDQATVGITAAESEELARMNPMYLAAEQEILAAVAATELALTPTPPEAMPDSLRRQILASVRPGEYGWCREPSSRVAVEPLQQVPSIQPASRWWGAPTAREWLALIAMAAAVVLWLSSSGRMPLNGTKSPSVAVAEFSRRFDDAQSVNWEPQADPAAKGASGRVLWSDQGQQGYMVFEGLAANDETKSQYQLWIFDAARDAAQPVDGGVFDIPPGSQSVIVPIDAKLPIQRATMFAVTIERPGGVVVSKRDRLPLLAKLGTG